MMISGEDRPEPVLLFQGKIFSQTMEILTFFLYNQGIFKLSFRKG